MVQKKAFSLLFLVLVCLVFFISCNDAAKPVEKKIVVDPGKMDQEMRESIETDLAYALQHDGQLDDTIQLKLVSLVNYFYAKNEFVNIWSHKAKWDPMADSLINFLLQSELYGLFPQDYHLKILQSFKSNLETDSLKKMDAENWARADLLFTDGLVHLLKDLKTGRLPADSTFLNKSDSGIGIDFYTQAIKGLIKKNQLVEFIGSLEPKLPGYLELKKGIPRFLDSMDRREYSYINYPFKQNNEADSLFFIKTMQKRLEESGCIKQTGLPDSSQLNAAIKKFQKKKGIKQDGKISAALIRSMNLTDLERFKRIAITLDRYKQLPSVMPEKYIWVNLPAYYLYVWDHDSIVLGSKIICGKPATRTPTLYSTISDMVTYPTWTVPTSIIAKQYLPKLKSNPNYLAGIGLRLVDEKGNDINPETVNWNKYTKGIPFKVMQASGDDNALGIMKFNFNNPFSVYLHDTNQRYLFKNGSRAFSHGCVRVQQWQELAFFIARNDSMNVVPGDVPRYNTDSIKNWLSNKEKRRIVVKNRIPLFITYFCCEGKANKIRFYDDIYEEDKQMREKYFSDK